MTVFKFVLDMYCHSACLCMGVMDVEITHYLMNNYDFKTSKTNIFLFNIFECFCFLIFSKKNKNINKKQTFSLKNRIIVRFIYFISKNQSKKINTFKIKMKKKNLKKKKLKKYSKREKIN